jgi:hypothetical protein
MSFPVLESRQNVEESWFNFNDGIALISTRYTGVLETFPRRVVPPQAAFAKIAIWSRVRTPLKPRPHKGHFRPTDHRDTEMWTSLNAFTSRSRRIPQRSSAIEVAASTWHYKRHQGRATCPARPGKIRFSSNTRYRSRRFPSGVRERRVACARICRTSSKGNQVSVSVFNLHNRPRTGSSSFARLTGWYRWIDWRST